MALFAGRKLLRAVFTVWIAATVTFLLLRLLPSDPTLLVLQEDMTPELRAALLQQYGLDKPLVVQYVLYLKELLSGNLGFSFRYNVPVTEVIAQRLPWTLLLTGAALVATVLVGIPLGVRAATRRGGVCDVVVRSLGISSNALFVPSVAMLLLLLGGSVLGWFPIGGSIDPDTRGLAAYGSLLLHLALPLLTLLLVNVGPYAFTLRASMIEILGEDYIKSARAHGLTQRRIAWRHALRNAIGPALTLLGLQLGSLVGGAVLTESTFAYPGLGRLTFDAVQRLDFPVLQGAFLLLAVTVVVANLLTDLALLLVNPRIRT